MAKESISVESEPGRSTWMFLGSIGTKQQALVVKIHSGQPKLGGDSKGDCAGGSEVSATHDQIPVR